MPLEERAALDFPKRDLSPVGEIGQAIGGTGDIRGQIKGQFGDSGAVSNIKKFIAEAAGGGGSKIKGFTAGGLTGVIGDESVDITRSPELAGILSGLSGQFGAQAESIGGLLGQVEPGFGRLTETAVSALEQRRRAAVGNLRENLARRRIGGSSFAAAAVGRTEAEFAKQESEIRAKSFLAELDAKTRLINQQAQARQQSFNVLLQQTQFEAALGVQMATGVSTLLTGMANAQAQLAAQESQAEGQLLGTALGVGAAFAL